MVSVRFVHHHTIDGVSYLPGDVVAFPPALAARLVYASRAVYTDGPPSPSADPLIAVAMAVLVAGSNITIEKNAATGKATISATVTGGAEGVDAEGVRDAVWAALRGTNGVQVTQDDPNNLITITLADVPMSAIAGLTVALGQKAPLESPTFTGTVAGITKAMVGLGNVPNTSAANLPLSNAAISALATKVDTAAVAEAATASTVVARTASGQIKAAAPAADDDAATRAWVLAQVGTGGGSSTTAVGRTGRVTVASVFAPAYVKDACDFVCTGTDDQLVINQALLRASRPNDGFGGEGLIGVELVGPTFYPGHNNTQPITMYPSTALWGNGAGTLISPQYGTAWALRGVIELLNTTTAHVRVSDLTIGRHNAVYFNGSGIKFTGAGDGAAYEIKSGPDPYNWISHVNVHFANSKGIWLTGTTGGSRESQLSHCLLWNCMEQGLLIDNSSDSQVSDMRANGGGAFPRFEIGGGNTKIANCKAYYSGNQNATAGDGFLFNSSRVEAANLAAQDCGGWGFRFTSTDVSASGLAADSNSRQAAGATTGGFEIAGSGFYSGLHAFDRGQTPASPQVRGIVITGSPQIYLTGRSRVPSGTEHVVGTPGANSHARVVRDGTTLFSVG